MEHPQTEAGRTQRGDAAPEMDECIKTCLECARLCQQARAQLQAKQDAGDELLALLLDCAECCELCARWMQRGSAFAADLCALCATVCKTCEEACEALPGDELLQKCAEACRRCFDTCLRMGQAAPTLVQ